jgi:hypothetical protein
VWEGYGLTHEQWRERFVDVELRMTSMLGLDPRLPSLTVRIPVGCMRSFNLRCALNR